MAKKKEEGSLDFNNIDDVNTIINRLVKEMMAASISNNDVPQNEKSAVYGFNIKVDQNGISIVERSKENPQMGEKLIPGRKNEPLIDMIEHPEEIVVIMEMPGIARESIKVSLDSVKLIISAMDGKNNYDRRLILPDEVDPAESKARYNNGILEISLKKGSYNGKSNQIKVV